MMEVVPSVFATEEEEYKERFKIASQIAGRIHVDVMDGSFVKNTSPNLNTLHKISRANMEVHLMVEHPHKYLEAVKKLGAKRVYLHLESHRTREALLQNIFAFKEVGLKVGIAVNPKTKIIEVKDYLDLCDAVLVMSIEPGKEGQKFLNTTNDRVSELRKMTKKEIGVDGGMNKEVMEMLEKKGADFAVVGSAIFSKK